MMPPLGPLWRADHWCLIRDPGGSCLAPYSPNQFGALPKLTFTLTSPCVDHWMKICFARPPALPVSVFNFAVFLTALTLMAIVFTITEVSFRFRVATAPIPLVKLSYWAMAFIGLLTLASDIIFSLQ